MSLKQEIETWVAALALYDNNEFSDALRRFDAIADTSKILFNCGVIHATLGEHTQAVSCYARAVQLDQYLAVAYFQQGVSNFLMGYFEEALANFNDALLYLRGNKNIDYEQLGLKFKLYSCEVLFNRGLCYIYLQQQEPGMNDLVYAAKEKQVADHDVIDEAIREKAEGYTVFSIPVGVVYRPNEAKVKNLKTKDYLGKAKLVLAQDTQQYGDPRKQAALAAMAIDDRPQEKLSYAALHLVRPDLRSRQQSEPPLRRNIFPPTPPPEERPDSAHGRRRSGESLRSDKSALQQARPGAKALRLELGVAAFDQKSQPPPAQEKPRLGTRRAESERPSMRREASGTSTRSHDSRRQRHEHHASLRGDAPDAPAIVEDPIAAYSKEAMASLQPPSNPSASSAPHHQRSRSSIPLRKPTAISEEDEGETDPITPSSSDPRPPSNTSPLAFEILPPGRSYSRQRSHSRRPPAPEVRKIRIKVHGEDMRYVMVQPTVTYEALEEQIRTKFSLKEKGFKLKIKDEEGDMVVLGDQDDLDMAVSAAKSAARQERVEMGKMEMWVHEI